jgi:hypothetical protein
MNKCIIIVTSKILIRTQKRFLSFYTEYLFCQYIELITIAMQKERKVFYLFHIKNVKITYMTFNRFMLNMLIVKIDTLKDKFIIIESAIKNLKYQNGVKCSIMNKKKHNMLLYYFTKFCKIVIKRSS